jgi:hypothetical protein
VSEEYGKELILSMQGGGEQIPCTVEKSRKEEL